MVNGTTNLRPYPIDLDKVTVLSSDDPFHIQKAQKYFIQLKKMDCKVIGLGKLFEIIMNANQFLFYRVTVLGDKTFINRSFYEITEMAINDCEPNSTIANAYIFLAKLFI